MSYAIILLVVVHELTRSHYSLQWRKPEDIDLCARETYRLRALGMVTRLSLLKTKKLILQYAFHSIKVESDDIFAVLG